MYYNDRMNDIFLINIIISFCLKGVFMYWYTYSKKLTNNNIGISLLQTYFKICTSLILKIIINPCVKEIVESYQYRLSASINWLYIFEDK